LTLFNGDSEPPVRHLAHRLKVEVGDDPARQIERVYRLTLCRAPTDNELSTMQQFLRHEAENLRTETTKDQQPRADDWYRDEALVRLCRVMFNLNEFVYAD
jgi:hypothetical protein